MAPGVGVPPVGGGAEPAAALVLRPPDPAGVPAISRQIVTHSAMKRWRRGCKYLFSEVVNAKEAGDLGNRLGGSATRAEESDFGRLVAVGHLDLGA